VAQWHEAISLHIVICHCINALTWKISKKRVHSANLLSYRWHASSICHSFSVPAGAWVARGKLYQHFDDDNSQTYGLSSWPQSLPWCGDLSLAGGGYCPMQLEAPAHILANVERWKWTCYLILRDYVGGTSRQEFARLIHSFSLYLQQGATATICVLPLYTLCLKNAHPLIFLNNSAKNEPI